MTAAHELERFLRAEERYAVGEAGFSIMRMTALVFGGAGLFGAALGSWSLNPTQMFYASIKVPMLLVVSTIVCLPNFLVVNTLLGLRDDFRSALRAILSAQVALAVVLAALSPLVLVVALSFRKYEEVKLANGLLFLFGSFGAQVLLRRHYRALITRDRRHRIALVCWPTLYVFVAAQLGYTLRPFIGAPFLRVQFFREEAWTNVYLQLFYMGQGMLGSLGWLR